MLTYYKKYTQTPKSIFWRFNYFLELEQLILFGLPGFIMENMWGKKKNLDINPTKLGAL